MRFTFYTNFNTMAARQGMEAAAEYAAGHGFSAVEMLESAGEGYPRLIPDRETARKTKQILRQRGLEMACWSVGTSVYNAPEAVKSLMRQAEIASELECPYLHHTLLLWLAPFEGMPTFEEGIDCAVEAAAQVARYAQPLGVKCIYEDQGLYANGVKASALSTAGSSRSQITWASAETWETPCSWTKAQSISLKHLRKISAMFISRIT